MDRSFTFLQYIYVNIFMYMYGATSETSEVCIAEEFRAQCPAGQVILTESALYGRMELGRCVKNDYGHVGCRNDVHPQLDQVCSGRPECKVKVPEDLKNSNTECVEDLALYLAVNYLCIQVAAPNQARCSKGMSSQIHGNHGYISSHVTQQTGCGHPGSPWIIITKPGQNIQLWLLDFSATNRQHEIVFSGCSESFGYILERSLNVNKTICQGAARRTELYKSKTNKLEINIKRLRNQTEILIEFSVIGCPELIPPAHAWYKREGNDATIGCKTDDRKWLLQCDGSDWNGLIGNCSSNQQVLAVGQGSKSAVEMSFSSIVLLTGVICAAVLLIIIVVVAGTVYIKKQSIKHGVKLRSEYGTATLPTNFFSTNKNPGYDTNTFKRDMTSSAPNHGHEDNQPLVHIWERTLPDPTKPMVDNMIRPESTLRSVQRPTPTLRQGDLLQ